VALHQALEQPGEGLGLAHIRQIALDLLDDFMGCMGCFPGRRARSGMADQFFLAFCSHSVTIFGEAEKVVNYCMFLCVRRM
jgi:hypothetical protein